MFFFFICLKNKLPQFFKNLISKTPLSETKEKQTNNHCVKSGRPYPQLLLVLKLNIKRRKQ